MRDILVRRSVRCPKLAVVDSMVVLGEDGGGGVDLDDGGFDAVAGGGGGDGDTLGVGTGGVAVDDGAGGASAGGGGKGMRVVENAAEFEEQMRLAQSEARSAFGDDAVFIEKYVTSPKHIEVQVLGDKHGNILYLFERECSIQRRHQKVIEEAPSAVITPELRKQIGESAVNVARACNYYGAGTVEFIVDGDLNFYFLEMNTRLQVEHPVTEMITGIDLVKEQIKIARGEAISFKQEDLRIHGHAIELRVYAEDPANNFLPDIGTLHTYKKPEGNGIRIDDGFEEGMAIPIYYDPMIAKMIVHGKDRAEAIDKMIRAIDEYKIVGLKNTLKFGKFVLQHEQFISGKFDTGFVPKYFKPEYLVESNEDEMLVAAFIATQAQEASSSKSNQISGTANAAQESGWKKRTSYRS